MYESNGPSTGRRLFPGSVAWGDYKYFYSPPDKVLDHRTVASPLNSLVPNTFIQCHWPRVEPGPLDSEPALYLCSNPGSWVRNNPRTTAWQRYEYHSSSKDKGLDWVPKTRIKAPLTHQRRQLTLDSPPRKQKPQCTKQKARNRQKIVVECIVSTRQISCILPDLLLVDQNSETSHVLGHAFGDDGWFGKLWNRRMTWWENKRASGSKSWYTLHSYTFQALHRQKLAQQLRVLVGSKPWLL